MAWYAIHVMTGREDIVCEGIREHLEKEGYAEPYKLFVVKRELLERRQQEYVTVLKIMFPGYVLVESEDIRNLARLTQNHKGVFRYLTSAGMFQEIAQREMAQIICLTNEEGLIGISDIYRDGDQVMVLSGPLENCWGKIVSFDTHNRRAKVQFEFDGGSYVVGLGVRIEETWDCRSNCHLHQIISA